jgi:protein-tyrosine phosphatase
MDRLPKFRKKPKNPSIMTDGGAPAVQPAEPVDNAPIMDAALPIAKTPPTKHGFSKRAGFRGLHLRGATKRARSPPPAALPQSPTTAIVTHDGVVDHFPVAPPTSTTKLKHRIEASEPKGLGSKPHIPSFLTFSAQGKHSRFCRNFLHLLTSLYNSITSGP